MAARGPEGRHTATDAQAPRADRFSRRIVLNPGRAERSGYPTGGTASTRAADVTDDWVSIVGGSRWTERPATGPASGHRSEGDARRPQHRDEAEHEREEGSRKGESRDASTHRRSEPYGRSGNRNWQQGGWWKQGGW